MAWDLIRGGEVACVCLPSFLSLSRGSGAQISLRNSLFPSLCWLLGAVNQSVPSNPGQGVSTWSRLGSHCPGESWILSRSDTWWGKCLGSIFISAVGPARAIGQPQLPRPLERVWFWPLRDKWMSFVFYPASILYLSNRCPLCLREVVLLACIKYPNGRVIVLSNGLLKVKLLFWVVLDHGIQRQDGWAPRQRDS